MRVVARLVERLSKRLPSLDGVGVSVGGVVDDRSVVREGSFLGWRDVDLAGPLQEATGVPVVVTNDVSALAREQLWFGAGRTHSTFGLITVGAGLGFGLVREGHVVEQLIDNGHLLGHAPIDTHRPALRSRSPRLRGRVPLPRRDRGPDGGGGTHRVLPRADPRSGVRRQPVAHRGGPGPRPPGRDVRRRAADGRGSCWRARTSDHCSPPPRWPAPSPTGLRLGPDETQPCELDVSTAPLTFVDWARGAAVVSLQHSLGAL